MWPFRKKFKIKAKIWEYAVTIPAWEKWAYENQSSEYECLLVYRTKIVSLESRLRELWYNDTEIKGNLP